jgi:hypothetical protein
LWIVVEVANRYVASVAQQASDAAGIVAVVNVQASKASGTGWRFAAYGAAAVLCCQHLLVGARQNSVQFFQVMVSYALDIFAAPSLLVARSFLHVVLAPVFMLRSGAGFALPAQSVVGALFCAKFGRRFVLFARPAPLHARRWRATRGLHYIRALARDLTGLAVRIEPIRLRFVFVKFGGRLFLAAGLAEFHGSLRRRVNSGKLTLACG